MGSGFSSSDESMGKSNRTASGGFLTNLRTYRLTRLERLSEFRKRQSACRHNLQPFDATPRDLCHWRPAPFVANPQNQSGITLTKLTQAPYLITFFSHLPIFNRLTIKWIASKRGTVVWLAYVTLPIFSLGAMISARPPSIRGGWFREWSSARRNQAND